MVILERISKSDHGLYYAMLGHYSGTYGFVGRQLIYRILFNEDIYGYIAGGSATKNLPGRLDFLGPHIGLKNIVNNTFFHLERKDGKYPCRNFTAQIIKIWRHAVCSHWPEKYDDQVLAFETLVEVPRTGDIYKRDGWTQVGLTQGFVCKRIAESVVGKSTDSWSGKRVWTKDESRRKHVFVRFAE